MTRELPGGGDADANPRAELHLRSEGDPDERRHRGIAVRAAEERALELRIRRLEGAVVPVEAPARLGRAHEQRQEHAAEERLVLVGAGPRVGAREDRRRRLTPQLRNCDQRVVAAGKRRCARLDVAAHERLVLVQGRPARRRVRLEGERQLVAALDLAGQVAEGSEAETVERAVEAGRAHRGPLSYAPRPPSPAWQAGHQYAVRASSPCRRETIGVPQRGHGRPTRR